MIIKIKNEAGEWVDGTPSHGDPVKYAYNNGGTVETFYCDPDYAEPDG